MLAVLLLAACSGGPADAPAPLPPLPARVEADPLPAREAPEPLKELVVAWTGEVRGEVEPCGCPTVPYGGFARRARLLERLDAEGPPVFVLDAGEMLVKGFGSADLGDRALRGRAVLDLARRTGLDAWAPSPVDLLPGGLGLLADSGAISATWRPAAGTAPFPGARVIERGGVRLGVVGVSAPTAELSAGDAVDAVRQAMAEAGDADAWVALSNAPAATALAVAEGVPGLGAVLSLRGGALEPPRTTAGAPVFETPDRGRYVSVLRAALGARPGPWTLVDEGPPTQLRTLREVGRDLEGPAREAHAARLEQARAAVAEVAAGRRLVTSVDVPLGSDLDGRSAVDAPLAAFADARRALARQRSRADAPARYASASACVRCHTDRFAAWAYTPHARAEEALLTRGEATNPECVGCHLTAWGQPGGFAELDDQSRGVWKGVQCEACHGPLAGHPDAGPEPEPVTEATCLRCHDEANSPQFDHAGYLARISCTMLGRGGASVSHPAAP